MRPAWLALVLAGCVASEAAPPLSGGAAAASVAGTPHDSDTYANCVASTPTAEGDVCHPSDSAYTLLSRDGATWVHRYPGIGFDVTPPTSTGWTARNSATIAATAGFRRLTNDGTSSWKVETRATPSDPTTTPYWCNWVIAVSTRSGGEVGVGWFEVATTKLVLVTSHTDYLTHQDYNAGYSSAAAGQQGQIGGDAGGPTDLVILRTEETATVRKVYLGTTSGAWVQLGTDDARTNHMTADALAWGAYRADADMAPYADLVSFTCGSL